MAESCEHDVSPVDNMRKNVRWILLIIGLAFFAFVMSEVLDPFDEQGYVAISHGNHSHYVPENRDPDVPIDQFPTRPPGPEERINAQGQIVPK